MYPICKYSKEAAPRIGVLARLAQAMLPFTLALNVSAADDPRVPLRAAEQAHAGPQEREVLPQGTVRAVVVKSWSGCSGQQMIYQDLNANWSAYGGVPIHIDYQFRGLCDGNAVTYEKLVASGADVVILSDSAVRLLGPFTSEEVDALRRYLEEGHDLIGTFMVFYSDLLDVDNRRLAPLFGLPEAITYGRTDLEGPFHVLSHVRPLRNIGSEFESQAWPYNQTPKGKWNLRYDTGARMIAKTADKRGAIMRYCGNGYRALYVSSMPDHMGGVEDKQLFYDMIATSRRPGCTSQ